ncbi:MAG: aminoglycoside phosphotransferase [Spirochaetaceae bacterium]|nr:MAG: aminoglycoside phosphotransferase [Spirochaetaceae bacterium]
MDGYELSLINPHDGGRNLVYACDRHGADSKILRVSFLQDRRREDILGEVEYVRYLSEHGGSVANVVSSLQGNLVEEIVHHHHPIFLCLFERAAGVNLDDNDYVYRENAPLSEFYYSCGKTLGKMHQLSKEYAPVHRRYGFFDKYNARYIDELIPDSLPLLKKKLTELLTVLEGLDRDRESYGMIHFDYNEGNFNIDYDTGQITVYDFDNACFGWYMYDLADLWRIGVAWSVFEPDAMKRRTSMDAYFRMALEGYRSETGIEQSMLDALPLFLKATLMENIVDVFETMRNNNEEPECDEWLSYCIQCMEDDIEYIGFFDEIYSHEDPFECEPRVLRV